MKKNFIHYFMYTILICIIILQCDDVFTDNPQAVGADSSRPVTVAELGEKTRVIKGSYYGGPAYDEGTPFRFNINSLAPTIDVSKVFVVATGYKTDMNGVLENPCQIEWSVSTSGEGYMVDLLVTDNEGNPYQDPSLPGTWRYKKVKLQFHAYYADAMPDATFVE